MPLTGQPITLVVQDVEVFLVDVQGLELAKARFVPAGDDLVIIAENGDTVLIEGYYMLERHPALQDHFNTVITAAMISGTASVFQEAFQDDIIQGFSNLDDVLPAATEMPVAPLNEFEQAVDVPLLLNIRAGDIAVLNARVLPVPCPDQAPEALTYTFLKQGKIGLLTAHNKVLKAGDTFTHKDLLDGQVVYYHDESHGPIDTLALTLTDAQGEEYNDILITVQVHSDLSTSVTAH